MDINDNFVKQVYNHEKQFADRLLKAFEEEERREGIKKVRIGNMRRVLIWIFIMSSIYVTLHLYAIIYNAM